jgi:hypothetical protein
MWTWLSNGTLSLVASYPECVRRYWGRKISEVVIYYGSLELWTHIPLKVGALI